jgi:putative selenate reductase
MVINTLDESTARAEAARCLQCDEICSVCVSVCPNRANVEFQMNPVSFTIQQAFKNGSGVEVRDLDTGQIKQKYQILNIGDYCNECGNCATFCPTSGAPYKDKPKFHLTADSFNTARFGYRFTADDRLEFKNEDQHATLLTKPDGYIYEDNDFRAVLDSDYSAIQVEFNRVEIESVDLQQAAQMAILSNAVRKLPLFNLHD